MSNSIDPDEMAHYEPSHLDLCRLQKPIIMPVAVKELLRTDAVSNGAWFAELPQYPKVGFMT